MPSLDFSHMAEWPVYTSTGQILLQHRTPDAFSLPNHWAFFGEVVSKLEKAQYGGTET